MSPAKKAPVRAAPTAAPPFDAAASLLAALDTSDRITRYLVEAVDSAAWRAEPPQGKGRDIASIVAHIHNVRLMRVKAAGAPERPEQLDRHSVTPREALDALSESHTALRRICKESLADGGKVKGFKPDVTGFVGYLIAHEAHHRGQISMLARQCGHPIPQKVMFGMWEWGSRGKEVDRD